MTWDRSHRNRRPTLAPGHYVYRLFDAEWALLYIGCSATPLYRIERGHRYGPWGPLIAHYSLDGPFSRRTGLAVESTAIAAEDPRYNVRRRSGVRRRQRHPRSRVVHRLSPTVYNRSAKASASGTKGAEAP